MSKQSYILRLASTATSQIPGLTSVRMASTSTQKETEIHRRFRLTVVLPMLLAVTFCPVSYAISCDICDSQYQFCEDSARDTFHACTASLFCKGQCLDDCLDAYTAELAVCTQSQMYCEEALCEPVSPIILDLDRNNFHLSGLDDPVSFDINADGQSETITWTQTGQQDAFLCLDRNQNGRIDDGTELFGNFTPSLLDGSTSPNGYVALAEFDSSVLGGMADGFIDEHDAIYGDLCVWIDSNHNGISETDELSSLALAGVERIGLSYSDRKRRDQHGNEFRYLGDAWMEIDGNSKHISTVDVFFQRDGN